MVSCVIDYGIRSELIYCQCGSIVSCVIDCSVISSHYVGGSGRGDGSGCGCNGVMDQLYQE